MNAEQIALALLAAGNVRGLTPEEVAAGAAGVTRVATLAAIASERALLIPRRQAIAAFGVKHPTHLNPSHLDKMFIDDDQVEAVIQAIHGGPLPPIRKKASSGAHKGIIPATSIWTDEVVAVLKQRWAEGLSHREVAVKLATQFGLAGLNEITVAKKLQRCGCIRSPDEVKALKGRNGRTITPKRAKVLKERKFNPGYTPKPKAAKPARGARPVKVEPPKLVSDNDRDLIADFLARKAVTPCPEMPAWGSVVPQYIGRGRAA